MKETKSDSALMWKGMQKKIRISYLLLFVLRLSQTAGILRSKRRKTEVREGNLNFANRLES